MSFITELEQTILTVAKTARPDLNTSLGVIDHSQIPPGSFPFAYTTAFARSQAAADTGTVTTYTGALVIVGEAYTGQLVIVGTGEGDAGLEGVRDIAEAIDTALAADLTLGGIVANMLIGIDSFPDPSGSRWVSLLVFEIDAVAVSGSASGAISWQLDTSVLLTTTSVATWEADRAAAIVTALGAGAARFDSDLTDPPIEAVPSGAARFSLSIVAAPYVRGSNATSTLLAVKLRVFHSLAGAATERSYTMATMLAQMLTLAAPAFWKGAFADAQTADGGEPEISELTR